MELYLIRHTTPAVAEGVCYGQADLDVTDSFQSEAENILPHLPPTIGAVYSSPLQRCRKLAERLFPNHSIIFDDRLKEINCGEWELNRWDGIEPDHLHQWISDLTEAVIPKGESYRQLYHRVVSFFEAIPQSGPAAVVTHGGVIRSLLAHIGQVELAASFDAFPVRYGCTIKIIRGPKGLSHQYLHNPVAPRETHRPSFLRAKGAGL